MRRLAGAFINQIFELVPTDSDWIRAKLPIEIMFELLRTPSYSTIQGDQWQFCCKQPMIYVGEWSRDDFARRAPHGNGEARIFDQGYHSFGSLASLNRMRGNDR